MFVLQKCSLCSDYTLMFLDQNLRNRISFSWSFNQFPPVPWNASYFYLFVFMWISPWANCIIVILALLSCLDELNVTYQINYLNALVLVQVSVHLIPRHIAYNYPRQTSSSVGKKKERKIKSQRKRQIRIWQQVL